MTGHAGLAAAAVRYLRSAGTAPAPEPVAVPARPALRCVREDERAPVGPADFRRVLGTFATGVAVVTSHDPMTSAPASFACQSFSSLSLDPPLVAFMVGRTSATWPRIARAGAFCVNVLSAGQGELCRAFAVSGADAHQTTSYGPKTSRATPPRKATSAAPTWWEARTQPKTIALSSP